MADRRGTADENHVLSGQFAGFVGADAVVAAIHRRDILEVDVFDVTVKIVAVVEEVSNPEVEISLEDNSTSLFKKMGEAALRLILRELPKYLNGEFDELR